MSISVSDKTIIDLDILKLNYNHDSLPHHLWYMALDCKRRRDAFWRHYKRMKLFHNMISIPLLILSSVSGITSVLQVGNIESNDKLSTGRSLPIAVSCFSVSAALVTALQKYFRFTERSEHSKHMAKNYARISKRIENNLVLIESAAVKIEPSTFLKFMEDVQKDTESLLQETDDMPKELISNKHIPYDMLMKEVKNHKKELHTPFASSAATNDVPDINYSPLVISRDGRAFEGNQGNQGNKEAIESLRGMILGGITDIEEKLSQDGNLKSELAVLRDNMQKGFEGIIISNGQ